MKRFKFRLQRVLEYREGLRKESERELALKNRSLSENEDRLREIESAQENCVGVGEAITTMAELAMVGDYRKYLQQSLVEQRERVVEATKAVEEARDVYLDKMKEEDKLSTLKEKQAEEHKAESMKAERKRQDELTVTRFRLKETD